MFYFSEEVLNTIIVILKAILVLKKNHFILLLKTREAFLNIHCRKNNYSICNYKKKNS